MVAYNTDYHRYQCYSWPDKKVWSKTCGRCRLQGGDIQIFTTTKGIFKVLKLASQKQIHPRIFIYIDKPPGGGSSWPLDPGAGWGGAHDCRHAYVQHSAGDTSQWQRQWKTMTMTRYAHVGYSASTTSNVMAIAESIWYGDMIGRSKRRGNDK